MKAIKSRTILTVLSCLFLYLCALIILSPLLGTLWMAVGLKWNLFVVALINIAAILAAYGLRKVSFFHFATWHEFVLFGLLMIFTLFIYAQVSTVLSIQQDQSLYIMRAFNLLNYGTLEKSMSTFTQLTESGLINLDKGLYNYGSLANGNQILNGVLVPDFYAGASYFYAIVGSVAKQYAFYGQTLIMLACSGCFYYILKFVQKSHDKLTAIMYSMTFVVAPVVIWFGRSSSTEPLALLFWLVIVALLLADEVKVGYLMIVFVAAILARIDYFVVGLLGIFIITYKSRKAGAIYTAALMGFSYIISKVYWIYFNRISERDFRIIKYQLPMMVIVFIASYLIQRYARTWIEKMYKGKFVKYALVVFGILVLCMMFRNTLTPDSLKGHFTEFGLDIFSNEEYILDNLFTVFPAVIIALGLLGSYKFAERKDININAGFFVLPLFAVSCYFIYKSGNAPQMYFLFRRYLNVFLPSVLIFFVMFIESQNRQKRLAIALVMLLLSGNLYMDSKQRVEYAGLGNNVIAFTKEYPEHTSMTIFYDNNDKTDISPLISYGAYDMVPLQSDLELHNVASNSSLFDAQASIFMTTTMIPGLDTYREANLSYWRTGESLVEVPKDYYLKDVKFYVYSFTDVIKYLESHSDATVLAKTQTQ